jgi:4-amino-4-deoxy-L-arabinose transferase-like glycosyltransferase
MNKKTIFSLIILFLLLHVALFSIIPLSDPSEARYATIAKEMAESNNYIMPHIWIEGELIPFMGKPPLGFWAMALSIEIFGANEFAVRFPSFVASILLLLIIFYTVKKNECAYKAVTATLITATSAAFYVLSGFVLVDIWLCLFSMGAILWYRLFIDSIPSLRISKDEELIKRLTTEKYSQKAYKKYSILVFIFLALGFLTKGPVVLIFFGLPIFLWTFLNHRWDTLKYHAWIIGLMLFVIIITPWFILAEKSTPGYTHYFFVIENFKRFVSSDKSGDIYSGISHAVPKGTAILYTLVVCLPWVLIQVVYFSYKKKNKWALFIEIKKMLINAKKYIFNHEKSYFNLYLTGLISITLFWCISSHLMLYYMIMVTPLFAIYCAQTFYKYKFSYKKVANIAIILLILYSLSYIPIIIFVQKKKSTKSIALKAVELYNDNGLSGDIIFARKTPYSAYFYTGNLIAPHKKERVVESLNRGENPGHDLYILRKRYVERILESERDQYITKYRDKAWAILQKKITHE